MSGLTTHEPIPGRSLNVLATFPWLVRVMQLHWSAMSCMCLEAAPKKATISATLPLSASRLGDGILSRTWVPRHHLAPDIA
jgi:hypothetical protein